jgi:hypothetical protein
MIEAVSGTETRKMEELLAERTGRRVELYCGDLPLRGQIVRVESGIVNLDTESGSMFVSIQHIRAFIDDNDENKNPIGIGLKHNRPEPL